MFIINRSFQKIAALGSPHKLDSGLFGSLVGTHIYGSPPHMLNPEPLTLNPHHDFSEVKRGTYD